METPENTNEQPDTSLGKALSLAFIGTVATRIISIAAHNGGKARAAAQLSRRARQARRAGEPEDARQFIAASRALRRRTHQRA